MLFYVFGLLRNYIHQNLTWYVISIENLSLLLIK